MEEKPKENLLKSGTEFESEPSDLMPDSFLSYLSSCKNLIGDISNYKEERLDADDWIGQFDQTITDAHNAAREAEEFEKLQLLKIEERRNDWLYSLLNTNSKWIPRTCRQSGIILCQKKGRNG